MNFPADPVDVHVGARLRTRRRYLGMSQTDMAKKCGPNGITFQQVQKYEKGVNRISASRLVQLAAALDVPAAWFFAALPGQDGSTDVGPAEQRRLDVAQQHDVAQLLDVIASIPPIARLTVVKSLIAQAHTLAEIINRPLGLGEHMALREAGLAS